MNFRTFLNLFFILSLISIYSQDNQTKFYGEKFNFKNVPTGNWAVYTEVVWFVRTYSAWLEIYTNEKQGGTVYEYITIPDSADAETFEVALSSK